MDETVEESHQQHFTPIQSRRFRTPLPCWSLCPSMDLLALGSGSVDPTSQAADSLTVYRIVSWQRLLTLSAKELTSHDEDGDVDWDLVEDGCAPDNCDEDEAEIIQGATSVTWSPDGRLVAIGLQDGGVLIHSVEATEEEEGEGLKPLHVIRTANHAQDIVAESLKKEREQSISQRVTRSMAAKQKMGDTPEKTTTPKEKKPEKATAIIGLAWKRMAPYHSSWPLSADEWEIRESWKITSQLIHRGDKFLPSECYNRSTGDQYTLFSPLAHLNVLCVATENELHWYLQSRYRVMTSPLTFGSSSTIKRVNMVCSPDMSTVMCVAEHKQNEDGKAVFASDVKVFSCPLLVKKRFDLQILAASYRSIFSRLRSVKHGIQSALVSWGSALRPLDMKFQRLFQLFRNYNVVTENFEVGAASRSIREELLRFILSGRSTVVGDASNALDQFFTRADMHDQLLLREASGVKASLGSIESKLRSGVQSGVRALVYEAEELYGLVKTHHLTAADSVMVGDDTALRLYTSSRILYLTFERFIANVVEARSRTNDFLAWMRGTATEIRARGTAADSIMRQHARDRRCSHGVACRVTDFLSTSMKSPHRDGTDLKLGHRKLTECIIGVPLSDNLAEVCNTNTEDLSGREPTLSLAIQQTFHATAAVFNQPRNVFSKSLNSHDLRFDTQHSLIAVHTRIGACGEDPSGDGYFSPQLTGSDNQQLQSPYWVIVARNIYSDTDGNLLEINAIPSDVMAAMNEPCAGANHACLQAHICIGDECTVVDMSFYSDDGNSSLAPNLDMDAESKEGRQALGLIVWNGENEEIWIFQYDSVSFTVCELSVHSNTIRIPSNIKRMDGLDLDCMSIMTDEEGEPSLKKRLIRTQENDTTKQASQLGLCGSRGTGGVLTFGPSISLEVFDLEEDEDGDDNSDVEIDDADKNGQNWYG